MSETLSSTPIPVADISSSTLIYRCFSLSILAVRSLVPLPLMESPFGSVPLYVTNLPLLLLPSPPLGCLFYLPVAPTSGCSSLSPSGCPSYPSGAVACCITPSCLFMDVGTYPPSPTHILFCSSHCSWWRLLFSSSTINGSKAIRLNFVGREELPSFSWLELNSIFRSKGSMEPSDCTHVEVRSTVCSQGFFFFNYLKLFFYWGVVLHCCVSFCYIAEKWISYLYT